MVGGGVAVAGTGAVPKCAAEGELAAGALAGLGVYEGAISKLLL